MITECNVTLMASFLWARKMSVLFTLVVAHSSHLVSICGWKKPIYKTKNRKHVSQFTFGFKMHVLFSRFILGNYIFFRLPQPVCLFFFFFNTLVKIRARCVQLEASWRCEMQNTPNMQSDHRYQLMTVSTHGVQSLFLQAIPTPSTTTQLAQSGPQQCRRYCREVKGLWRGHGVPLTGSLDSSQLYPNTLTHDFLGSEGTCQSW